MTAAASLKCMKSSGIGIKICRKIGEIWNDRKDRNWCRLYSWTCFALRNPRKTLFNSLRFVSSFVMVLLVPDPWKETNCLIDTWPQAFYFSCFFHHISMKSFAIFLRYQTKRQSQKEHMRKCVFRLLLNSRDNSVCSSPLAVLSLQVYVPLSSSCTEFSSRWHLKGQTQQHLKISNSLKFQRN